MANTTALARLQATINDQAADIERLKCVLADRLEESDLMRRERDRALEYAEAYWRTLEHAKATRNIALELAAAKLEGRTDAELVEFAANLEEDNRRRMDLMPKRPEVGDPLAAAKFKKLIGWED